MKNKIKEQENVESSLNYFIKFNVPKDEKILDIGCNYVSKFHLIVYPNFWENAKK